MQTPPKRPSGGARATAKRHAEQNAAREREAAGDDWKALWRADVDALGPPPRDPDRAHGWLGRAAVLIVEATMRDTAMPFEQMRRDAMRQIESASKVLDPAKLTAQLDELERALEDLRNARNVETREDSAVTTRADLF